MRRLKTVAEDGGHWCNLTHTEGLDSFNTMLILLCVIVLTKVLLYKRWCILGLHNVDVLCHRIRIHLSSYYFKQVLITLDGESGSCIWSIEGLEELDCLLRRNLHLFEHIDEWCFDLLRDLIKHAFLNRQSADKYPQEVFRNQRVENSRLCFTLLFLCNSFSIEELPKLQANVKEFRSRCAAFDTLIHFLIEKEVV